MLPGEEDVDRTQLSVKIPESLKDEFKQETEQNGENMTDAINKMVAEYVGDDEPELGRVVTPSNPKKEKAYAKLREVMNDDNIVPLDTAKSMVSQVTSYPKQTVSAMLLKPLERKDFVTIQNGYPGGNQSEKGVVRVHEYKTNRLRRNLAETEA